jgi:hypothetical protein
MSIAIMHATSNRKTIHFEKGFIEVNINFAIEGWAINQLVGILSFKSS